MDGFTIYSPTCFIFGKDTENQAGSLVKRFGGTRALLLYGGGSALRSGLIGRVKASLESEGIPHRYHESKGIHDMIFWQEYIVKAADWMFS